jgi:ABC-type dipeptide/oligopeptide/nickel transport system permease component
MNDILYAFYMTMELWIFLAILLVALCIEEGVIAHNKKKLVDNPTLW